MFVQVIENILNNKMRIFRRDTIFILSAPPNNLIDLKGSGSFFNIVIFFIESIQWTKKNVIIKLFEPSERRIFFLWPEKLVRGY